MPDAAFDGCSDADGNLDRSVLPRLASVARASKGSVMMTHDCLFG